MPIIGLDLGRNKFRAVELDNEKGKVVLKKYGTYENSKLNLASESKGDLDAYSNSIKSFISDTGFSTTSIAVSLPESEVFTRVIKLPLMTEKELKTSIMFEAEQYIPLPLKDVNFAFQIIDADITEKDKMNVLLVAAKNTILEKYVNILKNAGLVPKGIEPETLAIERALSSNPNQPSASILVNIGSHETLLIVTYRGFVRFTRSLNMGGDDLTKAAQQHLGLDIAQAEEYKKTYGLDVNQVEGKVYEAVKPVVDNILAEIKRSRIFYTTHNPSVNINKVILSGGTALMPGLLFYFANNLDLEVELANPWRNIQIHEKLESQKQHLIEQGPVFAGPVGLALKEVKQS